MNTRTLLTTVLLLVSTTAIASELHTWTNAKGKTIKAKFVKEQYGVVYLETEDGSVKQIKLSSLSKEDQERIAAMTDPFAAKKAAEAKAAAEKPKASKELYALFGDTLRDSKKKEVSVDALADKTIGIYFSAHWCPPCRTFTPKLVEFHNDMTEKGKPFEIVFVSSDKDSNSMYNYMKETDMPWLTLEFNSEYKPTLKKKYKVSGIPKLVIIDADGKLITENGRGDVSSKGSSAFKRWK